MMWEICTNDKEGFTALFVTGLASSEKPKTP